MAIWSTNNLACVNLWSTLFIMKQHQKTFKDAESIKMKDLLFFNPTLTSAELKFEAQGIADFLDNVFNNTYNSTYEVNISKQQAISDMVDMLIQGDKTLPELAAEIDVDYNF